MRETEQNMEMGHPRPVWRKPQIGDPNACCQAPRGRVLPQGGRAGAPDNRAPPTRPRPQPAIAPPPSAFAQPQAPLNSIPPQNAHHGHPRGPGGEVLPRRMTAFRKELPA